MTVKEMWSNVTKLVGRAFIAMALIVGLIAAAEMSPLLMGIAAVGMASGAVTELYVIKH